MDKNDKKKQEREDQEEEIVEPEENDTNEVVEKLEEEKKQWEEKYKRALADYQNLEKRSQENRSEWVRSANRTLLLKLLPVLDTLEVAQKHSKNDTIVISIQQFLDILKGEGITRIATAGKKFDPSTMECIVTEEGKDGVVLEELRAGYMLYDTLLRAAQVKVGEKV